MVYAEVIVKQRTNAQLLSYLVPATILPYVKVGSLVRVPLRHKVVPAVVIALKRRVSAELRGRIRTITSMASAGGTLSPGRVTLIKRLASHYGASLAEVAFHLLDDYPSPPKEAVAPSPPPTPIFIQGVFEERVKEYAALMQSNSSSSFLFVFAQASYAAGFYRSLPNEIRARVIFDDGKAAAHKLLGEVLVSGEPFAVVSTLRRIFFPLRPGDFLIVDQPDHPGLKYRQRPFMGAKTIADFRVQTEGVTAIFGDVLPAVEDLPRFSRGHWQLQALRRQKLPLEIFNRQGSRELVVAGLMEKIALCLERQQRLLLLVLARGWASALICRNCSYILPCPDCGRTISVQNGALICRYCQAGWPKPTLCPECNAADLREVGEGVGRVAKELANHFSQATIQEVSSDQPTYDGAVQLTVATEKIISFPEAAFDGVVFLSIDRLLSGATLRGSWELAGYLLHFGGRTTELTIQTYLPDHPLWGLVGQGKVREFFQHELELRRRYKLPPYAERFEVVGQNSNLENLTRSSAEIEAKLQALVESIQIGPLEVDRAGGKYRARFSALAPKPLSSATKEQLRQQLGPAWHLDIEPL
jgi:primosomal protein N'